MPEAGPGSGAGDVVDDSSDDGVSLPSWLDNPAEKIRRVVYGMLVGGIAAFVEPLLEAITLVFAGSNPGVYAAPNEQYGFLDVIVLAADLLGGAVAAPVSAVLDVPTDIIGSLSFAQGSPVNGFIVNAVIVVFAVVVVRYGPVLLRAGVQAIPVIGGPLAALLGGAD